MTFQYTIMGQSYNKQRNTTNKWYQVLKTAASLETGADDCSCWKLRCCKNKGMIHFRSFKLAHRISTHEEMKNGICFTLCFFFSLTLTINRLFFYIPKVFGNPKNSLLLLSISVFLLWGFATAKFKPLTIWGRNFQCMILAVVSAS